MKKLRYHIIMQGVPLLLAAICLLAVTLRNDVGQAAIAKPLQQPFSGEYSQDGGPWTPLDDADRLSALEGDLILRGHFAGDISQGVRLNFYLNHIGFRMSINGELFAISSVMELHEMGLALAPSMCGRMWDYILSPGISAGDEIEIRLCNPHAYGNESAYRDFLRTLRSSANTNDALKKDLAPYSNPLKLAGGIIVIAAVMLIGAVLAAFLLRVPVGGTLWRLGLLSAFTGGYIMLDTVDFNFLSGLLVLNTYGRHLCMMLAVYWLGLCARESLTGRLRKTAGGALAVSGVINAICIVCSFAGVTTIYDTLSVWMASQVILCPLLLALCIWELFRSGEAARLLLLSYGALLAALFLDLFGVGASIYSHGSCVKVVFAVLFVFHFAQTIRRAVTDYQRAARTEHLERELENSRTSIMLSQLQPHFLYNVLNSIYYLCGHDPQAAQEAVDKFSDYLRNNMESLEQKEFILFDEEYQHIQTYLSLEKMRFQKKLNVVYDIEATDFLLPPLTVQPLVENAVKHGVTKTRDGGVVTISTRELEDSYIITVADTGRGFDPEHYMEDGKVHVGIQNVRARLHTMMAGTLTITSIPGEGTQAVVTIPKRRDSH